VVLPATSTASARRFVEQGTLRMLVGMQYLKALYFLGVDPAIIRDRYRGTRPRGARPPGARRGRDRSGRVGRWLRAAERATRPVNPEFVAAMARRWAALPEVARTPGQVLGRHGVGCEGTHGVFPRCDLACTPCYHSRDANRVRVDGGHTRREVEAQMGLLRRLRGPRAHAQLIGGEVTLLDPDDHAAALQIMREHGREPMSMTHGDIDADYLHRLVLGPDGRPRLRRVSFAGHFDSLMFGRRGIARPESEAALDPYRQRFVDLFTRLRREHGVRSFLAHNMTVTPTNLAQVADVVRATAGMGFSMLSFQPAAFLGDHRRWREDYRATTSDQVWAEIERGAGTSLDFRFLENGDTRCNRTAYGFRVGTGWYPLGEQSDPRDVATRDAFFTYFGPVNFTGEPPAVLAGKIARVIARHPQVVPIALSWARRALRRAGGTRRVARELEPRPAGAADVRDAPVHGHRRRRPGLGSHRARGTLRRPPHPGHPGTPRRLPLRHGAPRDRRHGARLCAARPAVTRVSAAVPDVALLGLVVIVVVVVAGWRLRRHHRDRWRRAPGSWRRGQRG